MLLVLRFIKLDKTQFITILSSINRFEIIDSISIVSVIHPNQEEIRIIKITSLKVSIKDHTSGKFFSQLPVISSYSSHIHADYS